MSVATTGPVLDEDYYFTPPPRSDYRVCTACVMDSLDPDITFDESGVCPYCQRAKTLLALIQGRRESGEYQLDKLAAEVKQRGRRGDYDCIIGLSGGVDSSYVAMLVKQLGLRSLAVHLDNGWDSELAVKNIEQIVRRLEIDLYTHVIDWEEFKDLQLSLVQASVVDLELLTDHAIFSVLYHQAAKRGIKTIILGTNIASESILAGHWIHNKFDGRNIRAIHRQYGTRPLRTFPFSSNLAVQWYRYARGIRTVSILDYLDYDKQQAMAALEQELHYRPYAGKHYESVFTRFYQAYILPRKFQIDKRRGHFSSLIAAGQMTRDDALEKLRLPLYPAADLRDDYEYTIKKWGLTEAQFEEYLNAPRRSHFEWDSDRGTVSRIQSVRSFAKRWLKRGQGTGRGNAKGL